MPSPLPGMNPYLERADIWEDFYNNLTVKLRSQLMAHLRPKYVAVLISKKTLKKPGVVLEDPVKEWRIEIKEVATGDLVTAIEILSPVNKRPGREAHQEYLDKRRDLLRTSVHLMEIDLLRSGRRPPLETPLPDAPYFVLLSRGDRRPRVEIWPITFRDPIPIVPVPLDRPDPDVPLDLGRAINTIYDEAAYDLRIDYSQPPPKPDLSPEDAAWLEAYLIDTGVRVSAKG